MVGGCTGSVFVWGGLGMGEANWGGPAGLGARAACMGRSVTRAAARTGLLQSGAWGPVPPWLVLLLGVAAAPAPHQRCLKRR